MTIESQSDNFRLKPMTTMKSNQEGLNKDDNIRISGWSVFVEIR